MGEEIKDIQLYCGVKNEDGTYSELQPVGKLTDVKEIKADDNLYDEAMDAVESYGSAIGTEKEHTFECRVTGYLFDAYCAYECLLIRYFMGRVDKRKMKRYHRRLVKAYRKYVKEG